MSTRLFINSHTSGKWKKVGIKRRSGVAVPLFSVYSKRSIGSGEIPDINKIIDWCLKTKMSVIQLLPLNELGGDSSPYNAISTFALEPMYLCINKLRETDLKPFRSEIRILKKNFPAGNQRVNYNVKTAKLRLLKKIFLQNYDAESSRFKRFKEKNFHWLKYYCLFKIITDVNNGRQWQEWDLKQKYIVPVTSETILYENKSEVDFHCWVQWQLYEQMKEVKRYAKMKKILLMGDIPFLVSRNSADVWAYKNYFKLDYSSGAPPDMYFSKGQRWGMPPYNWENIETDGFVYLKERLKYAQNFYDMYRIDHFVGLFRVWTIDEKTSEEEFGLKGSFDPEDERDWEKQGRSILNAMNDGSSMLPCAEDLGTVPQCSDKVLAAYGITGIDVQRWKKKFDNRLKFIRPEEYRINSVATLSTHDSSTFPFWYENESGTIDEVSFIKLCEKNNFTDEKIKFILHILFDESKSRNGRLYWKDSIAGVFELIGVLNLKTDSLEEFIQMFLSSYREKKIFSDYLNTKFQDEANADLIGKSLEMISYAKSIFCINLIMEYLYLDENILKNFKGINYRINTPGIVSDLNWSMVIPVSLEELKEHPINAIISGVNEKTGRS